MSVIEAKDLSKCYTMTRNKKQWFRNLLMPQKETVYAVKNIDLQIEKGASVGFIGPNGAGKSTTIKMLTGILEPSGGSVKVNGLSPSRQRKEYVRHIGVVFGNRSQLWWDLPVVDSFGLFREIYRIPSKLYTENLSLFSDMLDLSDIMGKPVRQLSLGQRMRCEIAASFLHDPQIVFMDEPTIGLDIIAKDKIRKFLTWLNQEKKVTLVVTSHDLADIVNVCRDLIVIDQGSIVFHDSMDKVADIHGRRRFIDVELSEEIVVSDNRIRMISDQGKKKSFVIDLEEISIDAVISQLSHDARIEDMNISSTPIEDIIKEIYSARV